MKVLLFFMPFIVSVRLNYLSRIPNGLSVLESGVRDLISQQKNTKNLLIPKDTRTKNTESLNKIRSLQGLSNNDASEEQITGIEQNMQKETIGQRKRVECLRQKDCNTKKRGKCCYTLLDPRSRCYKTCPPRWYEKRDRITNVYPSIASRTLEEGDIQGQTDPSVMSLNTPTDKEERENSISFKLLTGKSNSTNPSKNIPQVMITLPNGETANTNFTFFDALSGWSKSNGSHACNYIGTLDDGTGRSIISASGCLHLEEGDTNPGKVNSNESKMYFTLLSEKSPTKMFFTLDKHGKTDEVKSDGLDEASMLIENEYMQSSDFDFSSDPMDIMEHNQDYQENTTKNSGFPTEVKLNIALGVDKSIKEMLQTEDNIDNWVASVLCHMQTFYIHHSLKTRILFEVTEPVTYIDEHLVLEKAKYKESVSKVIKKTAELGFNHTNAHIWFTNLPSEPVGISGIAKYAMVCHQEKKVSLIRGPHRGPLETAGTAVHELGHTIGISHDFDDKKGKQASQTCKSTPNEKCCFGFMHYGRHKNYWSDCSVKEFRTNYKKHKWATSCLKDVKEDDKDILQTTPASEKGSNHTDCVHDERCKCTVGNENNGGISLNSDGYCTARCSIENKNGARFCGYGPDYEGTGSIDCSKCTTDSKNLEKIEKGNSCEDDPNWLDSKFGDGKGKCADMKPEWCKKHGEYSLEAQRACPKKCKLCKGI